ncbi:glycosyltransferase [Undibacter mobilis]|uniref:Glycosyltransferase n=2 Tax=Undibacter mobilis TaxID=2292256 RepID=A0A371B9Z0_9BRAD|nr:glycosyltransferase [Undibacter mobilis]
MPQVDAPALVPAIEAAPELTVILPTFNEHRNVPVVVERLSRALAGIDWEVIIVDDNSPDGTSAVARAIGAQDRRVRCIRRVGRRGLAGACIEGMLASQAKFVAVMDADGQHDETVLARMVATLRDGNTDLVVASRYIDGTTDTGFSAGRAKASQWSTALARKLLKVELTDPMSGFFMLRRDVIDDMAPKLSTQGFKILLDIAATGRDVLRVTELPYVFGARLAGESKLDARVALDFGQLLLAKLSNDTISYRFVLFCLVGATGIGAHMAMLTALHALGVPGFGLQQTIATVVAIAWNYVFNNAFTYRDQRLTGWAFFRGLVEFELICSVGAISNIGIASLLYSGGPSWWIAGLGGAVMGAVWNYAVSAAVVWKAQ